jgi:hypothetical protein
MSTLTKHRHERTTAKGCRQTAETFLRMAFNCRDALLRTELCNLAEEFFKSAEELEASSKS